MKSFEYQSHSVNDLDALAAQILREAAAHKIFSVRGEMGAGKTTLIKSLCKTLGVTQDVSSPTFALVNEYATQNNESVYHFDFYRINSITEALDMGVEEYFFSNHFCFIEWPERIESLLPNAYAKIKITEDHGERRILLTV